jgi:hypothetical protein
MAPEVTGASEQSDHGGLKWPLETNTLVVVFDRPEEAQNFLKALRESNIDVKTDTAEGVRGAYEIRYAFSNQGLKDKLVSHLNGEDDFADLLRDEAGRGAMIAFVTAAPEQQNEVLKLLSSFHPEFVEAKGRWVRAGVNPEITTETGA